MNKLVQKKFQNLIIQVRPIVKRIDRSKYWRDNWTVLPKWSQVKTTCFYMITGLIQPESKAFHLDKKIVTEMTIHQRAI